MTAQDIYQQWKTSPSLDPSLKEDIKHLSEQAINEYFTRPLTFGTGGVRGPMGVGISRLNVHTIAHITGGFGIVLKNKFQTGRVAISYDNRNHSKQFAIASARVLIHLGLEPLVFESLRPTPMLSFAVRHFNCIGGIMITASHNPKEDNGFKAYNETGAQVNLDEASAIIKAIETISSPFDVQLGDESLIQWIDSSLDNIYLNQVRTIRIHEVNTPVKIVYSPLHGTGSQVIPHLLTMSGHEVFPVTEQMMIDGNFTHAKSSNPEQKEAYELALKYAYKENADIVLVTDPDADRLGVAVLHHQDYQLLSGNQTAALELYYILSEKKKLNSLPKDGIVYTTIVTTNLIKAIAASFHLTVVETLTGFKFIGEQAELNNAPYLFGCEESYGSLISDFVRDKDAVQACFMLSEMASFYKAQQKTLVDVLNEIYLEYGFYLEHTDNFFFKGLDGLNKMNYIINTFRETPLQAPRSIKDYETSTEIKDNQAHSIQLPKSNVLEFNYDHGFVILRPSGTEPKLKIYYGFKGNDLNEAKRMIQSFQTEVLSRLKEYL
jgi:phosphoglucomutase